MEKSDKKEQDSPKDDLEQKDNIDTSDNELVKDAMYEWKKKGNRMLADACEEALTQGRPLENKEILSNDSEKRINKIQQEAERIEAEEAYLNHRKTEQELEVKSEQELEVKSEQEVEVKSEQEVEVKAEQEDIFAKNKFDISEVNKNNQQPNINAFNKPINFKPRPKLIKYIFNTRLVLSIVATIILFNFIEFIFNIFKSF